jgi:phosphatidylethanolamine/phosphatidyl-N-methylethanolamine N-methyltransferase
VREEQKAIERIYSRYSRIYDPLFGIWTRQGRKRAIQSLPFGRGEKVLEVGIGTGLSLGLYPRDVLVVGVDLSGAMLREARGRSRRRRFGHGRLARMDAGRLAFPTALFDKVLAFHVITVVPDPQAVLQEMKRVCMPGGDIVLVSHFASDNRLVGRVENALGPVTRRLGWKVDVVLEELLGRAALAVSRVERVNAFGYWRLVHCVNEEAALATAACRGS